MPDCNNLSPSCVALNVADIEQSETDNPMWDVVGFMSTLESVVRHASAIDCRYEHTLPVYSSSSHDLVSTNIFDAFLESIEMDHWTIDEINDALSTSAADADAFVKVWGDSWRFMGNVMNCVMDQYIGTMTEDDRERLLGRLQSDRAELCQSSD